MKMRAIIIAVLVISLFMALGCSQPKKPEAPQPGATAPAPDGKPAGDADKKPDEKPAEKADAASLMDKDTAALFKALDKFKAEDDFLYEKEFEALKKKAQEHAEKKDPKFIENLFILAEKGEGNDKKAANELLSFVISDYKGDDWKDHAKYRDKAIVVITTSDDPQFRQGCWNFLTYYYEPENITPKVLETFEKTDDKALKQEILERIGGPASGAFIDKNEEALNKICLKVVKDEKETPEMKVAAINILAYSGKKDENVKKELETLKDTKDETVKSAATKALEKLNK